jgi:hypothetical protein
VPFYLSAALVAGTLLLGFDLETYSPHESQMRKA